MVGLQELGLMAIVSMIGNKKGRHEEFARPANPDLAMEWKDPLV